MSDSRSNLVLEIVELDEGELAIRNPESDSEEPIMSVNFSEELTEKLSETRLEVARAMLTAGIQMITEAGVSLEDEEQEEAVVEHTLH